MDRYDQALAALQRAHDEGGDYTEELIKSLDSLSHKKGRPESDLLILRLADLLEKRGDDDAARKQLRNLLLDSPDNLEALSRLATLAEKHDDTSDAIQAYRGLMRLEEGDNLVPVVFNLIDACEKLERLSEVLDDLERAREKLPDHERLRDRIRSVYEQSGESNRLAEVLIDDAARRDKPSAKAALLAQAARLLIDVDPTRAQVLLEQAEQAHSSLESGVLLARLRAMRGQRGDAILDLERLAAAQDQRKPHERVTACWELAQLYLREDDIREAYDVLLQAQKLERRNGEVALMLGMMALDLDDEKTAGRALRSVTAMKARTATSQGARPEEKSKAYYLLSYLARQKGDTSAARRMAQRALGEDPDNTDAQWLLEVL
jgi:tetratricopeptide (TPR) repeat protein